MEEAKEQDYKIDLMSPIRVFSNKDNWKNVLLPFGFILFITGIIKYLLKINNYIIEEFLINILLAFFLFGYYRLYLSTALNSEKIILPKINLLKIIKISISLFLIVLPFLLIGTCFIFFIFNFLIFYSQSFILNIAILAISIPIFILFNIFVIFAECSYLKNLQLKDGFNYYNIWKFYKLGVFDVIKTCFQAYILLFPITLLFLIMNNALNNNYLSIFLIYSVYYSIFHFVKFNFIAQVYNNIKKEKLNHKIFSYNNLFILLIFLIILAWSFIFVKILNSTIPNDYYSIMNNRNIIVKNILAIMHSDFKLIWFFSFMGFIFSYLLKI